jgi:ribosomal protein L7/L12
VHLTSAQKQEIQALIASGQKIIAVKRYREITRVGLQEALNAVTQMASGDTVSAGSRTIPPAAANPKALKEAEAAALAAIREGNVIEAIKRYRLHTRLGLKEAKEAVDALGLVHRTNGRVNAKLAQKLISMVAAGQKQEAVDHLMANVGYDDVEARAFIGTVRAGAGGCAGGCLRILVGLGALIALWLALSRFGVFR